MSSSSIQDVLKYAELQMAAEAYLDASTPLDARLIKGNEHASRFTDTQAKDFTARYQILAHRENTGTGFSGTLFYDKVTQEKIISFRSTEFIDDAARDNEATNSLEIKEKGWAFGQIDDMKTWVDDLSARSLLPQGEHQLTVTGYSLGGIWPLHSTFCIPWTSKLPTPSMAPVWAN